VKSDPRSPPVDIRLVIAYAAFVPTACTCRVSFVDSAGICHTAQVSATSLFEAAALGVVEFRRCGLMDVEPGPAAQLPVAVESPWTAHEIPMRKLTSWLDGGGKSPAELAVKVRLREILAR
jgi:hypothetical protein